MQLQHEHNSMETAVSEEALLIPLKSENMAMIS